MPVDVPVDVFVCVCIVKPFPLVLFVFFGVLALFILRFPLSRKGCWKKELGVSRKVKKKRNRTNEDCYQWHVKKRDRRCGFACMHACHQREAADTYTCTLIKRGRYLIQVLWTRVWPVSHVCRNDKRRDCSLDLPIIRVFGAVYREKRNSYIPTVLELPFLDIGLFSLFFTWSMRRKRIRKKREGEENPLAFLITLCLTKLQTLHLASSVYFLFVHRWLFAFCLCTVFL